MGKTWYGDALEKVAGPAGTAAGGAAGSFVAPGTGTLVGSAIGGAASTHGIKWLRDKWGFNSGGVIKSLPGEDVFAIVHNGEMILKAAEATAVKKLMQKHGLTVPESRSPPLIKSALLKNNNLQIRLK